MSCEKKHIQCGKLSREFQKAVEEYLLVETELAPADIAVVFGSNGRKSLAEKAFELYQKGLVKKIVVTGGYKGSFKKTEAEDIQARLLNLGVRSNDILIENKSLNTGQNVVLTRQLIEKEIGLEKVGSIIAVGNVTASRRFLMTLKKHWPEAFVMIAPANPYNVPKNKWYKVDKFKCDVMNQYVKIPLYFEKGFIKEVDISDINRKAIQKRKFG